MSGCFAHFENILECVVFLCKNLKFMLSFLCVYSFCDQFSIQPVTHTFRTNSSFLTNFVEKIINFRQVVQDRLLVHFCHILENHLEKSKCI